MSKLEVYWIPQLPMKSFRMPVQNLREAALLLYTLAMYDDFQFRNNIKPDYCNTGGLLEWNEEEKEWFDWYDEDGEDFDRYMEAHPELTEGLE